MQRRLGRSNIQVSAMGLGGWAIGGPFTLDGKADGWGQVDDAASIRAIHAALDLGITFFDTADAYGAGHGERVLGKALAGRRSDVVIATKFGFVYDETTKEVGGTDLSRAYIRQACERSLQRLGTDRIDLYQLHCGAGPEAVEDILDTLDGLIDEGKIRSYAWSTDDPQDAARFAERPHCTAVQHELNVLHTNPEMLALCEDEDLASVNRTPLAHGFLSGKYTAASIFGADDFRGAGHEWVSYFEDGRPKAEFIEMLDAVRDVLTSGGRTLVQGALAWIWGRSERTIPIPGFKNVAQVQENAGAMAFGPLTPAQMAEIDRILQREAVGAD